MDVGGGLSVPYHHDEVRADLADYAATVMAAAREAEVTLLLEPGRFLVAESGALITEVLYRKHAAGKDFIVTDAGMNDLVRPALYQAYHQIDAVDAVSDIHGFDDGTGYLAFKRAHATLCALVADTSGVPHIHVISDPNAKNSIMQTGN